MQSTPQKVICPSSGIAVKSKQRYEVCPTCGQSVALEGCSVAKFAVHYAEVTYSAPKLEIVARKQESHHLRTLD